MRQLDKYLDEALTGDGKVVFVTGGPGRGKTTLINGFAQHAMASNTDLLAVIGSGNAYTGAGDPYLLFREAMGMLTGDVETKWAAGTISQEHAHRLWGTCPLTAQSLVEQGPNLVEVFVSGRGLLSRISAAVPDQRGLLQALRALVERQRSAPGDLEQKALFEQYTLVQCHIAERHPLLLLLDDLQWADAASINLLFHLGRRLAGNKILVVGAYRPEEVAVGRGDGRHPLESVLNEFKRLFGDVWIDLSRTPAEEGRQFVDAILDSESNLLGNEFRNALYAHTEGQPLFTIELLRNLQERGDLALDEGGCWVEGPKLDWSVFPARVEGVIKERIGRLEDELRELLAVASVEGADFTAQVVARVQELSERKLLRRLSVELEKRHRLVHARGEDRVGEHYLSRYRFTHVLFQRFLYNDLSAAERRTMHGEVARVLEELYAGETDVITVQLAHHYTESGDLIKGLQYSVQAAEKAEQLYAYEEALVYYHSALECAVALDQSDQMVNIYEAIGKVYSQHGPFQKGVEAFQRALELSTVSTKRAELKTLIGVTYAHVADESGLEYLQAALRELDPTTQKRELARATAMIGRFHHYQGRSEQAIDFLERARQLVEPLEDVSILTEIYGYLAGAFQQSQPQQIERSNEWAHQSIILGERMNFPRAIALGYEFLAENARIVGDWNESLRYAALDEEIGKKIGLQGHLAWAATIRAYAYHGKGDLTAAKEAAKSAQAIAEAIGDNRLAINIRAERATIEIDLGEDEAAHKNAEFAYTQAQESGQVQPKRWCYFALAYIATAIEDWDQVLDIADKWSELFGNEPFTLYLEAYLGKEDLESISCMMESIGDLETTIAQQPLQNQATAWRLAGRISTAQGNYHEAITFLDKAIMTFDELDSRLDLGRTIYHRGKLSYEMSQVDQAREKFNQAMEIFEKCAAKRDAERIRGLLKELAMA